MSSKSKSKSKKNSKKQNIYGHVKIGSIIMLKNGTWARKQQNGSFIFISKKMKGGMDPDSQPYFNYRGFNDSHESFIYSDGNFMNSQVSFGPCKYGNCCLRYNSSRGCKFDHPDTIDECLEMHDEYKKICPPSNPSEGDLLFYESGIMCGDGVKQLCSEITDNKFKQNISERYSKCSKARNEWYNKCEQSNKDKRRKHKITIHSMDRRSKDCKP